MKKEQPITYKILRLDDLHSNLLETFHRYQETNHVWFQENSQYNLKLIILSSSGMMKKALVIRSLQHCVTSGGMVIGAFADGKLIGFSNVEGELFGSHKEYVELSYIHVPHECRNSGVGRKMFELCGLKAKQMGAKKLYIGAHSSEEHSIFTDPSAVHSQKRLTRRSMGKNL